MKREKEERGGEGVNGGGREERAKESDETGKMKTRREIAGKPGRMCDELREREGRGGVGGERERGKKEEEEAAMRRRSSAVCFCLHFVSPPSEIFRGETHTHKGGGGGLVSESASETQTQDGSTCLAAYLTVCEAHKWGTWLWMRRGTFCTTTHNNTPAASAQQ